MARHVSENKELQLKTEKIREEIDQYTAALSEVSDKDRIILEDHIRNLRSKLLMVENARKKVLRSFYVRVNAK